MAETATAALTPGQMDTAEFENVKQFVSREMMGTAPPSPAPAEVPAAAPVAPEPAKAGATQAPAERPEGELAETPPAASAPPAAKPGTETSGKDEPDEFDKIVTPRRGDFEKIKANRKAERETHRAELAASRKELDARNARIVELEKAPPKLEAPPEVLDQIKALEARIAGLDQALIVADVQSHPQFKAHFDSETAKITAKAKAHLLPEVAEKVERVLRLQDPEYREAKLQELINDDLSDNPDAVRRLGNARDALDDLAEYKKAEIANSDKLRAERDAQRISQTANAQKAIETVWASTVAQLQAKDGFGPIQSRADDPAWNKQVEGRLARAKNLLFGTGGVTREQTVAAAVYAATLPDVVAAAKQEMEAKDAKIKSLETQIAGLTNANPAAGLPPRLESSKEDFSGKAPADAKPWELDKAQYRDMMKQMGH